MVHTFWPDHGEDQDQDQNEGEEDEDEDEDEGDLIETIFTNGNNEVVKIFNQKCVICLERDGVCAFRQCGHLCICEQFYQNKGNIYILKCVICRP